MSSIPQRAEPLPEGRYLRSKNTKQIFIYTPYLAQMAEMEPWVPPTPEDDPCIRNAKLAKQGRIRTDSEPLLNHIVDAGNHGEPKTKLADLDETPIPVTDVKAAAPAAKGKGKGKGKAAKVVEASAPAMSEEDQLAALIAADTAAGGEGE